MIRSVPNGEFGASEACRQIFRTHRTRMRSSVAENGFSDGSKHLWL